MLSVVENGHSLKVLQDLAVLCYPDTELLNALNYSTYLGSDGNTYYSIHTQLPDSQSPGTSIIKSIIEDENYTVEIWGVPSSYEFHTGVDITMVGGETHFSPNSARIWYDIENCTKHGIVNGYYSVATDRSHVGQPTFLILFHELAHAYTKSGDEDVATNYENDLRDYWTSIGGYSFKPILPNQGGCAGGALPIHSWFDYFPKIKWGCFIATAAKGGPNAPDVCFLRGIRENLLLRTRWGRQFFNTFYRHYYRFSPAIAEEMLKDKELKDSFSFALVTPLLNYFRLVVTRPNWDLRDVPMPFRDYLESMGKEMDEWLSEIDLPTEFKSISPKEAAIELSILLNYVLRSPILRSDYLESLLQKGALPLSGDEQSLILANQHLLEARLPFDEYIKIIGPEFASKQKPIVFLNSINNVKDVSNNI